MTQVVTFLIASLFAGTAAVSTNELRDYGEYLAGECTSCHKLDGSGEKIPSIVGWDQENFVAILKTYKSGERENKAMISVVKELDDEQMKALAVYFESLGPK